MSEIEKWRAYVEAHKFNGPTVKLLQLELDRWAVLDHEYNLKAVVSSSGLSLVGLIEHPPQRERPKPIIYEYADVARMSIDTGDLDL